MQATPCLAAALVVGWIASPDLLAQERPLSQEEYRARRTEKLEKAFLQKADWFVDYDKARAAAKQQGKWIYTYFSRTFEP